MALAPVSLRLRRAEPGDCRLVWQWSNAPEVRAASFEPDSIPWESHQQWFAAKLQDPRCHFFIILDPEQQPVGQVRLEAVDEQQATISISLAPTARGQGWGAAALRLAAAAIFRTTPLTAIHAYIKPDNLRSMKAFHQAGFQYVGPTHCKGQPAEHYLLTRPAGKEAANGAEVPHPSP